jgi:hypothetical protein
MRLYLKITTIFILSIGYATIFPSCKKSTIPEVSTTSVSDITQTSAISGGNIINNGGALITARGVCWSTSENPTISSSKTSDGTGNGDFTSSLTGLTPYTTNYVRAYATNEEGTAYGNELVFITLGRTIGESYLGGIIAYIFQSGDPGYDANFQHGLIAAPSDQSTGIQWYNGSYTVTGATATALGTGSDNTTTIVTSQGVGSYAAKLCYDLVLGGYDDWYLPSKDELGKLYANKIEIGGFYDTYYWSSSEINSNNASWRYFGGGLHIVPSDNKSELFHVRAIRSF